MFLEGSLGDLRQERKGGEWVVNLDMLARDCIRNGKKRKIMCFWLLRFGEEGRDKGGHRKIDFTSAAAILGVENVLSERKREEVMMKLFKIC